MVTDMLLQCMQRCHTPARHKLNLQWFWNRHGDSPFLATSATRFKFLNCTTLTHDTDVTVLETPLSRSGMPHRRQAHSHHTADVDVGNVHGVAKQGNYCELSHLRILLYTQSCRKLRPAGETEAGGKLTREQEPEAASGSFSR